MSKEGQAATRTYTPAPVVPNGTVLYDSSALKRYRQKENEKAWEKWIRGEEDG